MNDILQLMKERHSVRQYSNKTIPEDIRKELNALADKINSETGLDIQIIYDEPECFNSSMAHYGKFKNCKNYIVMAGKPGKELDEKCGYFGEMIVLKAQELGLNTCWTALTHGKVKANLKENEKVVIVIALGYGENQGIVRKSKKAEEVSNVTGDSPEWFKKGVEAALLAPTAINQQKFSIVLANGNKVKIKAGLIGPCLNIDLGIIKYHFEVAADKNNFDWE